MPWLEPTDPPPLFVFLVLFTKAENSQSAFFDRISKLKKLTWNFEALSISKLFLISKTRTK